MPKWSSSRSLKRLSVCLVFLFGGPDLALTWRRRRSRVQETPSSQKELNKKCVCVCVNMRVCVCVFVFAGRLG